MIRTFALIGMLLLAPASAGAQSVYDNIKDIVEQEQLQNTYDADIVTYLSWVFSLPEASIQSALSGNISLACEQMALPGLTECGQMALRIIQAAKQEARVRKLGRELQEIASGEEVPISYIPGRPISLFFDLSALLNIWTPGDKAPLTFGGDMSLVTKGVDEEDYEDLFKKLEELGTRLNELNEEERIAAVWRYDAGVRFIKSERLPDFPPPVIDAQSGPDTERQYLLKRWNKDSNDIEAKLTEMWNLLPTDNDGTPNLITYFVFAKMEDKLPENVIVWARKGGKQDGTRTIDFGDIGLAWKTPLLPVLPSILKRDSAGAVTGPIVGGLYPPDLGTGTPDPTLEGRKLCSDPVANKGYVCSPQTAKACPVPSTIDPDAINLINCKTSSGSVTTAGPDICRDLKWRTTPGHDPTKSGFDVNTQCIVERSDLTCPSLGSFSYGKTDLKAGDGHVKVQVSNSTLLPATYWWIHELVHAYNVCKLKPGEDEYKQGSNLSEKDKQYNQEVCCAREGEAYRAQCEAMELDGMFINPSTGARYSVNGIELNATVCAETFTDTSCVINVGGRCHRSRDYPGTQPGTPPASLFPTLMMQTIGANNPKNVPRSCTDAVDPAKQDERVTARLAEINARYDVTGSNHSVTYRNTLGNDMCYVGQAAEETFELHNVTPQRTPAGVVDEKNPFQKADSEIPIVPNPEIDIPLSNLPFYKPKAVINQLDAAICSQQGLPLLSPSILCSAQYLRRLQLPIADYVLNTDSLLEQQVQGGVSARNYDTLANGLGGRIATSIYERFAPRVIAPLMSLLKESVRQLKLLPEIPFPEEMCAIGVAS